MEYQIWLEGKWSGEADNPLFASSMKQTRKPTRPRIKGFHRPFNKSWGTKASGVVQRCCTHVRSSDLFFLERQVDKAGWRGAVCMDDQIASCARFRLDRNHQALRWSSCEVNPEPI